MKKKTPNGVIVYDEQTPEVASFIDQLPTRVETEGTTIHNKRNQIKVFEEGGHKLCVKRYAVPALGNRILYSLGLRAPKAKRHYDYAREIIKRGFVTPRPYGYLIRYKNGFMSDSASVYEMVENVKSVGDDVLKNPALLRAFAAYTADLHKHGLMHRDYILNNVLYAEDNGRYRFVLIDINRFVFRSKPLGLFLTSVNMMQPFHNEKQVRAFVREYERFRPMPKYFENLVVLFRKARTFYSHFKRLLKKIPGAKALRGKYTNQQK